MTTTADAGAGSLRQAILDANANPGADTIAFNIPGGGAQTIQPLSLLPTVTDSVVIDGYTQPGARANTLAVGDNAVVNVIIDGSLLPINPFVEQDGLLITAANTTIQGLQIQDFGLAAIHILNVGATGDVVQGNFLNTDGTQTILTDNTYGVIVESAPNCLVGGTAPAARNLVIGDALASIIVLSDNGPDEQSSGDVVAGNYIGMNASGMAPLAGLSSGWGGDGVLVEQADNVTVGGSAAGAGNVIPNLFGEGIELVPFGGDIERAIGNFVGTNATGTAAARSPVFDDDDTGPSGIGIDNGGDVVVSNNIISGWTGPGLYTLGDGAQISNNLIGTDITGRAGIPNGTGMHLNGAVVATGNTINFNSGAGIDALDSPDGAGAVNGNTIAFNGGTGISGVADLAGGNAIYGNTGPGIDPFGTGGVTPNTPNASTNFPVLSAATTAADSTTVSGTLNSVPNTSFRIEYFANAAADPTGFGQGQTYLGFATVTTDAGGNATFTATGLATAPPGQNWISSTSTDLATGETSEFSADLATPTASVSGPSSGVAGQVFTFTVGATDPSPTVQAGTFTYTVNWGDGTAVQTVTGPSSLSVTHAYAAAGSYAATVTATDNGGGTSAAATTAVTVSAVTPAGLQQQLATGGVVTLQTTTPQEAHDAIAAVNRLNPTTTPAATVVVDLGGQTIQDTTVNVPSQVTLTFVNGTFIGGSPALVVTSGDVFISNSLFINATNAPTILVTGGNLTLRDDDIQESTGYSDPAIQITGGTVDLGTAASPGGNTINVNGTGEFVHNATTNSVTAVGDTFQVNGTAPIANALSFTALSTNLSTVIPGESLTLTATVRANIPGSGTPSGSVDFFDTTTNTDLGTVALSGGAATQTVSLSALGSHVITASYQGSGTFLLSDDTLTETVIKNVGILLLDPTGQSLNVSGNAVLSVTNNGAIILDSTNAAAGTASGNASVTATEIDDTGGLTHSSNAAFHGTVVNGTAIMTDPLAALAAPTQPATQFTASSYSGTLQPGTYVGGITVSGNNSVTLQPGIYYLKGGGLTISGNATVAGTGVMIYITGLTGSSPSAVNTSGNAVVTLTPPTSGTYLGVVLYEDRTLNGSIAVSGNGALNTTGTEYAPGATVTLSGNDDTDNPAHASLGSEWIVRDLALSGNAKFAITADANNRSGDPNAFMVAGGPVHPAIPVATLTSAEARAAVQEALALWTAAGLDAGTVAALARAKVTIEPLPAPYLGLAAPGAIYLDSTAEGYG